MYLVIIFLRTGSEFPRGPTARGHRLSYRFDIDSGATKKEGRFPKVTSTSCIAKLFTQMSTEACWPPRMLIKALPREVFRLQARGPPNENDLLEARSSQVDLLVWGLWSCMRRAAF